MNCPWCDETLIPDGLGYMTCPYLCQDDCPKCDRAIGDCHENNECTS